MAISSRLHLWIVGAAVAVTAIAIALALTASAGAKRGCGDGDTTFKFDVPDGVQLKATHGAVKRGPSKIIMANCGGSYDPTTGVGSVNLIGGVNFKYQHNRGPTGEYKIHYGGVGKLRANVVGKAASIAKVSLSGTMKLTDKGAKLLNDAVESDDGPFEKGFFGTASTEVP